MRDLAGIFFATSRVRAWSVLGCLLIANLVEGIGLASILPLIAVATGDSGEPSMVQELAQQGLGSIGLAPDFGTLLTLVVSAIVLKSLLTFAAMSFVGYTAAEVASDLRRKIVANLMQVRWRYFIQSPIGEISSIVSNEATRSAQAYIFTATFMAMAGQTLVLGLFALLVSWKLTAAALIMGGAMVGSLQILVKQAKRAGLAQTQRTSQLLIFFTDTLSNLKVIRAMGRQAPFARLLDRKIKSLRNALRKQVIVSEAVANLQDAVMVLFLGVAFYFLYRHFDTPLSELVVSGIIVARTVQSVGKLQKAYQKAVIAESAFYASTKLIEDTGRDPENDGGHGEAHFERQVRFEGVRFAHEKVPVIQDLNVTIEARQLTVLTGPSGSGKSTMVDLLLGLHRPSAGRILLDGEDLADLDLNSWRRLVGYVPQDVILLHDTLRANLTLGDQEIDETDILQALERADIKEWVVAQPEGLETVVGERGGRLSGGQRQRIALARALVTRPRLLILDEVTSALDEPTAQAIAAEVKALSRDVTVLTISHRPEFIEIADRVLRMERGQIRDAQDAPDA